MRDGVIMSTEMPTGVAQADVNDGGFRRGRQRGLVVGEGGLELAQALQSQSEILMGFRVVRI